MGGNRHQARLAEKLYIFQNSLGESLPGGSQANPRTLLPPSLSVLHAFSLRHDMRSRIGDGVAPCRRTILVSNDAQFFALLRQARYGEQQEVLAAHAVDPTGAQGSDAEYQRLGLLVRQPTWSRHRR